MSRREQLTQHRRRSVLAVIMLAALLAGVAVAAILVEARMGPVRQGRQVLEQIRQGGLAGFWTQGEEISWFLHTNRAGQPVGWSVSRVVGGEGGYVGTELQRGAAQILREDWQLDARGQKGNYKASVDLLRRLGRTRRLVRQKIASTAIQLRDGRVAVQNEGLGPSGAAEARAPGNYIPEGMNALVYYLAASAGKKARFRLILNSKAFVGNRVRFITLEVEPAGPRSAVVRQLLAESMDEETWHFGRKGQLMERAGAKGGTRRVSLETLQKTYPEAARYAQSLSAPPDPNDPNAAAEDPDNL